MNKSTCYVCNGICNSQSAIEGGRKRDATEFECQKCGLYLVSNLFLRINQNIPENTKIDFLEEIQNPVEGEIPMISTDGIAWVK